MDNDLVKKVLTEAKPYVPTSQPGRNGSGMPDVQLVKMSDVVSKKLEWLWPGRIPYFMLADLQGDPGEGKSHIALAIATAISLGHGLPGMPHCESGNVLIAGAEDPLDYTVKPRLDAMGADASRIYSLKGMFTLDSDGCQLIENYIIQTTPKLVIIDPLIAYMSAGLDINRSNQVRQVTARLSLLAEKYRLAVLTVRHLTKSGSSKAIYRAAGSIDFIASARSSLLAGQDPETKQRALCHIKCNVGPKVEPIGYELTEDGGFSWLTTTNVTLGKILSIERESGSELEKAMSFLNERLTVGEIAAAEIYEDASANGISRATLLRAKDRLNVNVYKHGGDGKRGSAKWYWKSQGDDNV